MTPNIKNKEIENKVSPCKSSLHASTCNFNSNILVVRDSNSPLENLDDRTNRRLFNARDELINEESESEPAESPKQLLDNIQKLATKLQEIKKENRRIETDIISLNQVSASINQSNT